MRPAKEICLFLPHEGLLLAPRSSRTVLKSSTVEPAPTLMLPRRLRNAVSGSALMMRKLTRERLSSFLLPGKV